MKITVINGQKELKSQTHFKLTVLATLIFSLILLSTNSLIAQSKMNGKKSGGWGTGNSYENKYDTKTVETIFGEVLSIEKMAPSKGMSAGVHLMVKTSKEIISIHLGPKWFLDKQELDIVVKDKIEIKGSRIIYENHPAIIASEIIKGDKILILRSENGIPVWRGWRQR